MDVHRIPATIITGFLGSGKTTLVRHLLTNCGNKRLALIVNEFGDLGFDGDALCDSCDEIVELTNGCICCTVSDDFIPTMTTLLSRDPLPDHIIIETSGLALPQPLVNAFNWHEIRERVTVDGVITIVDSSAVLAGRFASDESAVESQRRMDSSLDHETPLEELFEDQITCADLVVLTKTDLVSSDSLPFVESVVRGATSRTPKILKSNPTKLLGADILLGLGIGSESDILNRRSHHEEHHADDSGTDSDTDTDHHHDHDHDDFSSFIIEHSEISDVSTMVEGLTELLSSSPDILRMKGYVAVNQKPMRLVFQAVGSRIETYYDRDWASDESRRTNLVVIGLDLDESACRSSILSILVRA